MINVFVLFYKSKVLYTTIDASRVTSEASRRKFELTAISKRIYIEKCYLATG